MKVMLCTPYEEGKEIPSGGITIWARNIINSYKLAHDNVCVKIQPFDRATYVSKDINTLQRYYYGLTEYFDNIRQTKRTLKKEHFDVIHLCSSANISLVKDLMMIHVAHSFGSKIAIHLHFGRIPEICLHNNWEWRLLKLVLKKADMIITMDQSSYSLLYSKGYDNVAYLPNPLSKVIVEQIETENKCIAIEPKTILFVGHVIETKGVYELAEATKGLPYKSLQIIGKCADDTKLQMLEINPNMTFVGEVPHDQVIKEMLAADIFVLPSYTEGFPNVILESMACGCAIISTEVGAIPEMLNYNSTQPCGCIVPPMDVKRLRNSIEQLLNNQDLCNEFRTRSVQRVNEIYSIDVVWKQLVSIWEDTALRNR